MLLYAFSDRVTHLTEHGSNFLMRTPDLRLHTVILYLPAVLLSAEHTGQIQEHIFIAAVPELHGDNIVSVLDLFLVVIGQSLQSQVTDFTRAPVGFDLPFVGACEESLDGVSIAVKVR